MEFTDPFPGMEIEDGGAMDDCQLHRAIRLNIASEQDAIHTYMAHADATDNECAKAIFIEIAGDERVHVGQLQELLNKLCPGEREKITEGAAEMHKIEESSYIKAAQKGGSKRPEVIAKAVTGIHD